MNSNLKLPLQLPSATDAYVVVVSNWLLLLRLGCY